MAFSSNQETKFSTRKCKNIIHVRPHSQLFLGYRSPISLWILKILRTCICKWMNLQTYHCWSLQYTIAPTVHIVWPLMPDYRSAAALKAIYSSVTWPKKFSTTQSPVLRCTLHYACYECAVYGAIPVQKMFQDRIEATLDRFFRNRTCTCLDTN